MDRLDQAVLDLERRPAALAVLFVDLDHFKDVNDSFGHDAGDHLLAEVGRRLVLLARRADTVGRLGGDEFVVLCRDLGDDDDVGRIGERIVCGLRAPYLEGGRDLSVTASVGIVVATDPPAQPERIVRDADAAMYEAKKAGRDCYRVDDSTRPNARRTNNLRAELRSAIESSELFLVYQPLFALGQRSLLGVEALVRWRHPERGVLLPNDFVPFAERHGLIAGIGSFVLDEACHQLAAWTERPGWPERFTMAVNISARELSDPGFRGRVAEVVRRHGLSPARLCLEVPETALIGEVGHVQETMSALSEMGVRIAVNDFGTGLLPGPLTSLERRHLEDRQYFRGPDQPEPPRPRDRRRGDGDVPRPGHNRRRGGHRNDRPARNPHRLGLRRRPRVPLRPAHVPEQGGQLGGRRRLRHEHGPLAGHGRLKPNLPTSARGRLFVLTSMAPVPISSTSDGSSARYTFAETPPWPLPWRRRLADRRATEGSSIVGPAIEPIWTQFMARLRSDRSVRRAMMACCAGLPHR